MFKKLKGKILFSYGIFVFLIILIVVTTFISIQSQKQMARYINLAGKLRMVSQELSKEALSVVDGKEDASALKSSHLLYDKILNGLLNGDKQLGLQPTKNEKIVAQLNIVNSLWKPFKSHLKEIINNGTNVSSSSLKFIMDNNLGLLKKMDKIVLMYEAESKATVSSLENWQVIFLILAIIAFISVYVFSNKKVIAPIVTLEEAATQVAQGNVEVKVKIDTNDEIARLGDSFNIMVKTIRESEKKLKAEKEDVERKIEEAVKESEEQKEYLNRNVEIILAEMDKFSNGDLTVSISKEKDDTIGKLFDGFNKVVKNIRDVIIHVIESVQATASASTEISSSAEQMASGSQEQSAQTAEVASAIEQMTATIIETSKNSVAAAEVTKESSHLAKEGGKRVNEAIEGMKNIATVVKESSQSVDNLRGRTDKINAIIEVIDEIADQTNLLALNAAIEAARAGEEGRGFAVVADEVRKLAERTTKATKEIAEVIKLIQDGMQGVVKQAQQTMNETDKGIKLAEKAGDELTKIIGTSDKVSGIVDQVAAASEEQSATAEQISKNIEQIRNVTNESASGVQQIAKAAEDLNRLTENLQRIVEEFNIDQTDRNNYVRSNVIVGEKSVV